MTEKIYGNDVLINETDQVILLQYLMTGGVSIVLYKLKFMKINSY